MSGEAREAVARALVTSQCCDQCEPGRTHYTDAEAVLAALQPFIAAEIRAWAESETDRLGCPPGNIAKSADEIADRITTTGER